MNRTTAVIQSVESQGNDLLQELKLLKLTVEKEVKLRGDTLQLALQEMEDFQTNSLELTTDGLPADITEVANDIHVTVTELLKNYVFPDEYNAPSYKFIPMKVDDLLSGGQNFIGYIKDSGN